jgi:hypothetical protein
MDRLLADDIYGSEKPAPNAADRWGLEQGDTYDELDPTNANNFIRFLRKTEREFIAKKVTVGKHDNYIKGQALLKRFYDEKANLDRLHGPGPGQLRLPGELPGVAGAGRFAAGGYVSRFKYGGTPGVDSVPAMLTPGEFVINADAASKNLGMLKQINSGAGAARGYNKGGKVQRFQTGGGPTANGVSVNGAELAAAIATFNQTTPRLSLALEGFNTSAVGLTTALNSFGTTASQLQQAIRSLENVNIPERIELTMADSTVTLTGETSLANALANAIGGKLGSIIADVVQSMTGVNVDGSPTGPEK